MRLVAVVIRTDTSAYVTDSCEIIYSNTLNNVDI